MYVLNLVSSFSEKEPARFETSGLSYMYVLNLVSSFSAVMSGIGTAICQRVNRSMQVNK